MKIDLLKVARGCMDWIDLAQDRDRRRALVSSNEPSRSIICGEVLD